MLFPCGLVRNAALTAGTVRKHIPAVSRLHIYAERVHELRGRLKAFLRIHRERLLHRLKLTVINVNEHLFRENERSSSFLLDCAGLLLLCHAVKIRLPGHGSENQPVHQDARGEDVGADVSLPGKALRRGIVQILPAAGHRLRHVVFIHCRAEAGELKISEAQAVINEDIFSCHSVVNESAAVRVNTDTGIDHPIYHSCQVLPR